MSEIDNMNRVRVRAEKALREILAIAEPREEWTDSAVYGEQPNEWAVVADKCRAALGAAVLAVGEACAGDWKLDFYGNPNWTCRCGAKSPADCITETARR